MNNQVNIIELNEASSLAKIISSKTAKDIIQYIGDHEKCTASQISKNLNLAASTVHYNLKALTESEIIDDTEFTYSSKGKQINHYSLSNKILIVVPKKKDIIQKINSIIPGFLTFAGILGIGYLISIFNKSSLRGLSNDMALESPMAKTMMLESENRMLDTALYSTTSTVQETTISSPTFWQSSHKLILLILGLIILGLSIYFIIKIIKKRK